jgi:hypothetical protein
LDFENEFNDFMKPDEIKENEENQEPESFSILSKKEKIVLPKNRARSNKVTQNQINKRVFSEIELENIIDWEFKDGTTYNILSGGDIDSLSFLKMVLRQQKIKYLVLSTWCMALQDIQEIERFLKLGRIEKLDCYVGEIFQKTYFNEYQVLSEVMKKYGGRVCVFRNHSKTFSGFGEKFDFAIASSANINTNPRCENTTITINSEVARFYKEFYDDVISYNKDFSDWKKTEV